jgi:hypothetical protein
LAASIRSRRSWIRFEQRDGNDAFISSMFSISSSVKVMGKQQGDMDKYLAKSYPTHDGKGLLPTDLNPGNGQGFFQSLDSKH